MAYICLPYIMSFILTVLVILRRFLRGQNCAVIKILNNSDSHQMRNNNNFLKSSIHYHFCLLRIYLIKEYLLRVNLRLTRKVHITRQIIRQHLFVGMLYLGYSKYKTLSRAALASATCHEKHHVFVPIYNLPSHYRQSAITLQNLQ